METVDSITPEEIDGSFVARAIDAAVEVAVGAELVVVGGRNRATVLNPTGALIWRCLDGASSLDELVTDLSDELAVDAAVVRGDVLGFARLLGAAGLLDGVGPPPPEVHDHPAWEPPPARAIGDPLDDFTLPDLDGAERSLSEHRGHRVLLVNWSPGCGYCVKIAAALAGLQDALAAAGVALVLLTVGDAEANRAVLAGAGLRAPALQRGGTDVDPFDGTGTPAAYLLDTEGRVASPMVVGSDQVPRLAAELAGIDPAVLDDPAGRVDPAGPSRGGDGDSDEHEPSDPVPEGTRYLPAPGAMCGPGGGGGAGASTEWAGTRVYRIEGFHVGIRYNTERSAELLDALFAGARVRDRRCPDNYSVSLSAAPGGGSRALNLLVHGSTQLVRSRSVARVLRALLWRLSAATVGFDPGSGRVQVNATAALRDDHAVVLPPGLSNWAKQLQPRLARVGVALADVAYPELDLATAELVIPEPAIPYAARVLDTADDGIRLGSELPAVLPGRYPLTGWCVARGRDQTGALSPAVAAVAALPHLPGADDLGETIEQLGVLFARIPAVACGFDTPADVVDATQIALGDH